jgi:hypothetical protein
VYDAEFFNENRLLTKKTFGKKQARAHKSSSLYLFYSKKLAIFNRFAPFTT